MAPKTLFITGGTGYIGSSVLHTLTTSFPPQNLSITALLRSPTPSFKNAYPRIRIAMGDFDSTALITLEAQNADIVLHLGDHNHIPCITAILSGLRMREEQKREPGFLIHLTGTGCIADVASQTWDGSSNPRIWNDVTDISEIYNLPDTAFHHVVDKLVMDADTSSRGGLIKTACVCPPDIYGQCLGISSRQTFLIPAYVNSVLDKKEGFYLGKGENYRAVSHISDVVDLFILLVRQAVDGRGAAQWGKEGFYFATQSEIQWRDAAIAVNKILTSHTLLPLTSQPKSYTATELDTIHPLPGISSPGVSRYLWGSNSRAYSERARKLGWVPKGKSFWDELEGDILAVVKRREASKNKI